MGLLKFLIVCYSYIEIYWPPCYTNPLAKLTLVLVAFLGFFVDSDTVLTPKYIKKLIQLSNEWTNNPVLQRQKLLVGSWSKEIY